jgi:hypothetical protein
VRHAHTLSLGPTVFRVQPGGRARTLRLGRKVVHAFAIGQEVAAAPVAAEEWVRVSYNPHKGDTFYRKDTGAAVLRAEACRLGADGAVWALQPS